MGGSSGEDIVLPHAWHWWLIDDAASPAPAAEAGEYTRGNGEPPTNNRRPQRGIGSNKTKASRKQEKEKKKMNISSGHGKKRTRGDEAY